MLVIDVLLINTRGLLGTLSIFNCRAILGPKNGHFLMKNAIFDDFWVLTLAACHITVSYRDFKVVFSAGFGSFKRSTYFVFIFMDWFRREVIVVFVHFIFTV